MKIIRQHYLRWILFLSVMQPAATHAQVSPKKITPINPLLKLELPDSTVVSKEGNINTYTGGDSLESYEITVFDTVIVKIPNASYFTLALKSFVAGRFAGEELKPYKLLLTDTLLGNLPGLFISGVTNDTLPEVRKFYCFVTMANSKAYWLYYYFKNPSLPTDKADRFFASIQFERTKIKEAAFKIPSFKKEKRAGQVWYTSPELDSPLLLNEKKDDTPDRSLPPRPPMPPIDRKWLFKAKTLASEYVRNRSLADKKYKNKPGTVFEGIVKEIKETDEHGITIIILDGAPANIDVQCEVLNSFSIKRLKKGMKATFIARCKGVNGNVILSGCIYIEKPTYE
jgi:hypothetical protein